MNRPKPTREGTQRIINMLEGSLKRLRKEGFAEEIQKEYEDEIKELTKMKEELPE